MNMRKFVECPVVASTPAAVQRALGPWRAAHGTDVQHGLSNMLMVEHRW
jgi:hypothetical protein